MIAAGTYLRTLREEKTNYSQKDIARAIRVNPKTIERWEAGTNEPGLSDLQPYIEMVRGSLLIVVQLLTDTSATAEDGRRAARQNAPPPLKPEFEAMLRGLPDNDLDAVAAIVARLLERH